MKADDLTTQTEAALAQRGIRPTAVRLLVAKALATAECAYKELQKKTTENDEKEKTEDSSPSEPDETEPARDGIILEPVSKKPGKLSLALAAMKLFHQKDSVIGNLIKHPEAHKIEAFVDGEDIHIDVRKRPSLA